MTTTATPSVSDRQPAPEPQRPSWGAWLGPRVQLVIAVSLALAVLAWLMWGEAFQEPHTAATAESKPDTQPVRLVGPGLIAVQAGTPLENKLQVVPVAEETLTGVPVLTVTGSVVASLRPGDGPVEDRWQFATPDLLSAYADWRKAGADVIYAEKALALARKLDTTRMAAQEKVVERLRKVVPGTSSYKELAAEETTLVQYEIQGQKEVHDAETAVRTAQRAQAALERQLHQAGVDPALLGQSSTGIDVVVADVPESKVGDITDLVRQGQGCQARFYGIPRQIFSGKVSSMAPVLSKERRTLRVLFVLDDPHDQLKPGMFADIGLGTDSRQTLLVPADAVLHVGRSDYVLVGTDPGVWKVVEVKVGEQYGSRIEVRGEGLQANKPVLGPGAILLKPFVVAALQPDSTPSPAAGSRTEQRQGQPDDPRSSILDPRSSTVGRSRP
jgi:membrane fusion protein, heavy metal efflux system